MSYEGILRSFKIDIKDWYAKMSGSLKGNDEKCCNKIEGSSSRFDLADALHLNLLDLPAKLEKRRDTKEEGGQGPIELNNIGQMSIAHAELRVMLYETKLTEVGTGVLYFLVRAYSANPKDISWRRVSRAGLN